MLSKDGIPTQEDLQQVIPAEERLQKGPVAILECFQKIPCAHCVKACPQGAITIGKDINEIPDFDAEKCIGCGQCITSCPGQAIFVVDMTYSDDNALVKFPFEFVPLPKVGQYACGLDRSGAEMGWFEVAELIASGDQNKNYIIALKVPKELAMQVRNIKVGGYK